MRRWDAMDDWLEHPRTRLSWHCRCLEARRLWRVLDGSGPQKPTEEV
jgi:hypothetical protein